jgi:hypothetical protein
MPDQVRHDEAGRFRANRTTLQRRTLILHRHPGLDPGSTFFLAVAAGKVDAESSPA